MFQIIAPSRAQSAMQQQYDDQQVDGGDSGSHAQDGSNVVGGEQAGAVQTKRSDSEDEYYDDEVNYLSISFTYD